MATMTFWEYWIIRRILRKRIIQGKSAAGNVQMVYQLVRDAWENEFTEDNELTHDDCLRECFEATQFYEQGGQ